MAWVKLDDQARHHRKVLAAGPVGAWLWVCGLMYCNSQKARDGFIPEAAVQVLYPIPAWRREAARLVAVGLWERVDGGYRVHDYHEYQPTAEDAADLSEKRRTAGRVGGQRSGETRRLLADPSSDWTKARARADLALAIKGGHVQPQPCAVCGAKETDGHHTDYRRPLDVEWLCEAHHAEAHASARAKQVASTEASKPKQVASSKTKPVPIPIPIPEDPHPNPPRGREPGDARISRPERLVDDGTAGMTELVAAYESAVAAATDRPFALPNERAVRTKLALAVNTHLRGDGTLRGAFAEVERAVAEWVDAYRDKPGITAGWAPRKFLDWLNAEREASPDEAPPSRVEPPADEAPRPVPVPLTPEERARRQALLAEIESNVAGKFL